MVTQEFTRLYKQLNPAQKKAVDTVEGTVMVIAGPGTGKTQILTLRIANILLKTQVNPENILALTFTENAAYEMRKRLLSVIGQDAYRVEITTFHSFCNNFIKKHQEEFAHIIAASSINEIEQLQIIEECMNSLSLVMLRPLGDLSYYLKPVMHAINDLKKENITPILFRNALKEFERELENASDLYHEKGAHKGKMKSMYQKQFKDLEKNKELLLIFTEYQKKLFEKKKYDYNDMLLEVIQKFETHPYLLQFLQEKFQYFLVDEHQDTNATQNKIIEKLCSYFENPNLFVVGDEKQAIFRFQGATIENFLYFKKTYPQAVLISLSENYRSTKTILDSASQLILNNSASSVVLQKQVKLIKRAKHVEEKISVISLSTSDLEFYWVTEKIKYLLKNKDTSIAILARNNRDLVFFPSLFEQENISYSVDSDSNILDDVEIQKIILLFRLIINPNNENVARALLLDCFNINPLDAFQIIRSRFDDKGTFWDLLTDKKRLAKLKLANGKEISLFVDLFVNRKNGFIKKAVNDRFDRLFVDVLNNSGLMKSVLSKPHAQEILTRFTRLYDLVKEEIGKNPLFSVSDFISYIDLLEKHDINLSQNSSIFTSGTVRLMTVHRAKGLEFDYVFLINSYNGHWGNQRAHSNLFHIPWEKLSVVVKQSIAEDENSDERRLFYVALTRAKKKVYLSFSRTSSDGREQIPSQFITEISKNLILEENVSVFENKLLSHREKMLAVFEEKKKSNKPLFAKEYISEIFRKQGLSVSALNNYLECPWKFFFINLIRVPEKIEDPGLFGNAIHGALNQYISALKKGLVSKRSISANKKFLIEKFNEELEMQSITPKEIERYKKRGIDALTGFYIERMQEWNKDYESELEIRGIRINDNLILAGKIDMIVPLGKGDTFDVYDFKTGKAKSRSEIEGTTKTSDGNYKRQLVFYKILLDKFKNGFYKMQNGVIEFVEPTEKGIFKREIFTVTKEEVDLLLKQVIAVGGEIVNLSFWEKICGEKHCEYCRLRKFIG
jgi:DNA helicase-2/ATP-dependent DNA helicase PcrA